MGLVDLVASSNSVLGALREVTAQVHLEMASLNLSAVLALKMEDGTVLTDHLLRDCALRRLRLAKDDLLTLSVVLRSLICGFIGPGLVVARVLGWFTLM